MTALGSTGGGKLHVAVWSLVFVASAVDVIDFGGGKLPITLTPFLLLSAALGTFALLRLPLQRPAGVGPSLPVFASNHGSLVCFLIAATLSAIFTARDRLDVGLARLFYLYLVAAFGVVFCLTTRRRRDAIIMAGTAWYIALDGLYVVVQYASVYLDFDALSQLTVSSVGELARPCGLTGDPNRAALNLLLMVGMRYIVVRSPGQRGGYGGWPSALAIVLSLVTLSRSGLLELATLLLTALVFSKATLAAKTRRLAVVCVIGGLLFGAAYVFLGGTSVGESAGEAMVSDPQRQTSTSIHFALIRRGVSMATSDAKAFWIGQGWGTEHEYTKDYFQAAKVGNFHSMFFSMLVQAGTLALAPFLVFLLRPMWTGSRWVLLTPMILLGGLFYQFHGEPFWWLVVVLANDDGGGTGCPAWFRPLPAAQGAAA